MTEDDQDLETFLEGFGISEEELHAVMYELESYRTIPGATLRKYINRILITIEEDDRPAFLKGLLLGIAIRRLVDKIQNEEIVL